MALHKDIKAFYTKFCGITFFDRIDMWEVVYILLFLSKGFSLIQVGILDAVWCGVTCLFELPTGAIADKYGRRLSLLLYFIISIAARFVFAIEQSFIIIVLMYAVWAIATTCRSGAEQAFFYDTLKEKGKEDLFLSLWSKLLIIAIIAQCIGSVLAGKLTSINLSFPIVVEAFLGFIPLALLLTMKEKKPEYIEKSFTKGLFKSFRYSFKALGLFLLWITLMSSLLWTTSILTSPYLVNNKGLPLIHIGIAYLIFRLGNIIGTYSSNFLSRSIDFKRIVVVVSLIVPLVWCLLPFSNLILVISLLFMRRVVWGSVRPMISNYVNKKIRSEDRATVLSVISLLTTLGSAFTSLTFCTLAEIYSIDLSFFCMGIVALALLAPISFLLVHNQCQ